MRHRLIAIAAACAALAGILAGIMAFAGNASASQNDADLKACILKCQANKSGPELNQCVITCENYYRAKAACDRRKAGIPCDHVPVPLNSTVGPVCLPQPLCPKAQPYASCDRFLTGNNLTGAHGPPCCVAWGCYRFHR